MCPSLFICKMLSWGLKSQRILWWRDKWENLCDVLPSGLTQPMPGITVDSSSTVSLCCYIFYMSLLLCLFLFHITDYSKDKRIIISVSRKFFKKLFSGGRRDDHSTGLPEVPPRTWTSRPLSGGHGSRGRLQDWVGHRAHGPGARRHQHRRRGQPQGPHRKGGYKNPSEHHYTQVCLEFQDHGVGLNAAQFK